MHVKMTTEDKITQKQFFLSYFISSFFISLFVSFHFLSFFFLSFFFFKCCHLYVGSFSMYYFLGSVLCDSHNRTKINDQRGGLLWWNQKLSRSIRTTPNDKTSHLANNFTKWTLRTVVIEVVEVVYSRLSL